MCQAKSQEKKKKSFKKCEASSLSEFMFLCFIALTLLRAGNVQELSHGAGSIVHGETCSKVLRHEFDLIIDGTTAFT